MVFNLSSITLEKNKFCKNNHNKPVNESYSLWCQVAKLASILPIGMHSGIYIYVHIFVVVVYALFMYLASTLVVCLHHRNW